MAKNLGKLVLKVQMENKQLLGKLEETERKLNKFKRSTSLVSDSFKAGMLAMATAAGGLLTMVGRLESDFSDKMAKVQAISGATAQEFAKMNEVIRSLGSTTRFTAAEAAEGMQYLSMAGLSAADAIDALPKSLQLAQLASVDMGRSADILTNVMTGFNLTAQDLAHVNDVLAASITSSNQNLEEQAAAIAKVAGFAPAMNQTLETITAITGVLANTGIKGEEAGTAIKMFMSKLIDPAAGEAQAVLKKYNIAIQNVDGSYRDLIQVMEDFHNRGVTLKEISQLVGERAAPKMMNAIQNGTESMKLMSAYLEVTKGDAETMAKIMDTSVAASFKKVKSASEELQLSMGDAGLSSLFHSLSGAATDSLQNSLKPVAEFLSTGLTAAIITGQALFAQFFADIWNFTLKVQKAFEGLKLMIYKAFTWAFDKVLEGLDSFLRKLPGGDKIADSIKDGIGGTISDGMKDAIDVVEQELLRLDGLVMDSDWATILAETEKHFYKNQDELDKLRDEQIRNKTEALRKAKDLMDHQEEIDNKGKALAEAAFKATQAKEEWRIKRLEEYAEYTKSTSSMLSGLVSNADMFWNRSKEDPELLRIAKLARAEFKTFQDDLKDGKPIEAHLERMKELVGLYDQQVAKLEEVKKAQQELADYGFKTMEESSKEFGTGMTQAMDEAARGMILNFQDIGDAFEQMGKRMLNTLAEVIYQQTVGNAISEFGKGIFGTGGILNFGSLFSGARAEGGPVSAGGNYLVGEEGPEMFVPNTGGTIIPADVTASLGSGSNTTIIQNISISPDVPSTTRRVILEQLPMIKEAAAAGVEQKVLRGGSYAKNIRGA